MNASGTSPPPPAPSASVKPAVSGSLPWSGTMKFFGGAGGGGGVALPSAASADAANDMQAIAHIDVILRFIFFYARVAGFSCLR